jgi:hypothetical protein
MWLITDQIKSKQCHFDVNRFSASLMNQSHIKATRNAPRYKFGYRIPRNYDEAMQIDLKNNK